MKALKPYGFVLVGFVLLATVVFRCGWGTDQVFSGSDANIGILAANHRALPARFFGAYEASPLFGVASKLPMSVSSIGKALLPPEVFSNIGYSVYLILSSIFLIAYLRLWNLRWIASVFGALAAFWVGSITMSAAGHLYKLGVMALFSMSLFLVEKSMRGRLLQGLAYGVATGLCVGLMLLEQQDVGLFAGLFLGVYTLFRLTQTAGKQWKRWCVVLLPIAMIGLSLSVTTAVSAYTTNVAGTGIKENPEQKWDFVTQWSMVPKELPELIAPGYAGWNSGNPEGPYWGECGQSAEWKATGKGFRNFRLDSWYIGLLPILFAVIGFFMAIRMKKEKGANSGVFLLWGGLAVIALLLSFGKYSSLYKLFYQLPLVGNIRAPVKLLHNFQVIIGILAAYGLDQLITLGETERHKWLNRFLWFGSAIWVATIVAYFYTLGGSSRLGFADWGQYASVISGNISRAGLHTTFMAGIFCAVVFILRKQFSLAIKLLPVVLLGAIVFDSVYLTNHYFKALDVSSLRNGNVVTNYLKQNQGDERIYLVDSQLHNGWLALDGPYHGLNIFNVWQMPRMPTEYRELLQASKKNPLRLWQLASIKYVAAPGGIMQQINQNAQMKGALRPLFYYRFVRQGEEVGVAQIEQPENPRDQVLLEFNTYVPRFSLFHNWEKVPRVKACAMLFSKEFDPLKTVLVDDDVELGESPKGIPFESVTAETSSSDAVVMTKSEQNGILLFTQRYQPDWAVYVDGRQGRILRCNYLCMGVLVPAGEHTVRFVYR